jgi:thiamine biosynthesis lipoprotein
MSPLVGRTLETLGYDRAYSLRPHASPAAVPAWHDTLAWDGAALTTVRPVVIDVGAAGKGYLVDIVGELLTRHGIAAFAIDASGDILHAGDSGIRVGLEHPLDPSRAIGVVRLRDRSLCASASNRRAWGQGLHHIIDATTGLPARRVIATWVVADTGLVADGLATALFFSEPERLAPEFDFDFVRMFADGRVEHSPGLDGEVFT